MRRVPTHPFPDLANGSRRTRTPPPPGWRDRPRCALRRPGERGAVRRGSGAAGVARPAPVRSAEDLADGMRLAGRPAPTGVAHRARCVPATRRTGSARQPPAPSAWRCRPRRAPRRHGRPNLLTGARHPPRGATGPGALLGDMPDRICSLAPVTPRVALPAPTRSFDDPADGIRSPGDRRPRVARPAPDAFPRHAEQDLLAGPRRPPRGAAAPMPSRDTPNRICSPAPGAPRVALPAPTRSFDDPTDGIRSPGDRRPRVARPAPDAFPRHAEQDLLAGPRRPRVVLPAPARSSATWPTECSPAPGARRPPRGAAGSEALLSTTGRTGLGSPATVAARVMRRARTRPLPGTGTDSLVAPVTGPPADRRRLRATRSAGRLRSRRIPR